MLTHAIRNVFTRAQINAKKLLVVYNIKTLIDFSADLNSHVRFLFLNTVSSIKKDCMSMLRFISKETNNGYSVISQNLEQRSYFLGKKILKLNVRHVVTILCHQGQVYF